MKSVAIDRTGYKNGMLTVIRRAPNRITPSGKVVSRWECYCDCGRTIVVTSNALRRGQKACECSKLRNPGPAKSTERSFHMREYVAWQGMLARCRNKNERGYKWYGGRGITVCERWMTFDNFFHDMGEKPNGTSLDRIDCNGNYEPSNCRWATLIEQANNKRNNHYLSFEGETITVAQLARRFSVRIDLLRYRIRNGWDLQRAITQPVQVKTRRSAA